MPTQAEIEAAARAIALAHFQKRRIRLAHPDRPQRLADTEWRTFLPEAVAALEAAERVREEEYARAEDRLQQAADAEIAAAAIALRARREKSRVEQVKWPTIEEEVALVLEAAEKVRAPQDERTEKRRS